MAKKSYPHSPGISGADTDNSRKERISELRKKGQLVKLKPTLFFSRAEANKVEVRALKDDKSLAEFIEVLLQGPKSYPSGRPATSSGTDNFAIWIEGKHCLESLIRGQEASSESEIEAINARLQSFHTKNVKGHTYWYMSDGNSGHKYIGREDPSPACLQEIKVIEEKTKALIKKMKACVHAPLGDHYIIALDKVSFRTGDQEIIELKTLLELSVQGPAAHSGGG